MNTKIQNSELVEAVSIGKEQTMTSQNKTRILIISDNSIIRQELSQLINHGADLEICSEAKDDGQAQGATEKQQVDLAIIDISSKDTKDFRAPDTTRFQYSNIPVVLLSIHDEAVLREHTLPEKTNEYFEDPKTTEQIIKAIRYTQSLLSSKIFGFTLAVNLERSPRNDH